MPILAATDPPRKHRVPVWALILPVVVLPPGVFAWSFHGPVCLAYQGRGIEFGRITAAYLGLSSGPRSGIVGEIKPSSGWWAIKLPGDQTSGWYGFGWGW